MAEPDANENAINEITYTEVGIQSRCQGQQMSSDICNNVGIQPQDKTVLNDQESHELGLKAREPSRLYDPWKVIFGTNQACMQLLNSAFLPFQATGVIVDNSLQPSPDGQYSEDFEFTCKSVLAAGACGKVYLCIDNTTQKEFVMKKINKKYKKTEVEILLKLNHSNIAKLFGIVHRMDEPELYMEHCGYSLWKFAELPDTGKLLTEDRIWDFMTQGLQALNCLAIHQIIHFDIKPENICIQQAENKYIVKFTDFGSATLPQEVISFQGCTAEYMSPEACRMFLESRFSFHNLPAPEGDISVSCQTDIFSWGMTVLFMIRKNHVLVSLITDGKNSYKDLDEKEVITLRLRVIMLMATAPHHVKECMIPDVENQHLKELLQGLLEGCPKKRWSPARALQRIEEIESSTLMNIKDTSSPLPSDQSVASSSS